jgi:hypothetical protein
MNGGGGSELQFEPHYPLGRCQYLGELNSDGVVDITDLLALLGAFGCTQCSDTDLNGDGIVSVQDVLILFQAWGMGD